MKLIGSWGSFLAGDQSCDRAQHRVEVIPSAEVTRQGPPVLQVADAVLDTDPLRRVSPAFRLVRRGDRGQDRVQVLASAEVASQGPPVGQVADAVLDTDPLGRVSSAVGLVRRGEGGTGSWFVRRAGRGVRTAPAVWALSPW